jgi:hypothetical protein
MREPNNILKVLGTLSLKHYLYLLLIKQQPIALLLKKITTQIDAKKVRYP